MRHLVTSPSVAALLDMDGARRLEEHPPHEHDDGSTRNSKICRFASWRACTG